MTNKHKNIKINKINLKKEWLISVWKGAQHHQFIREMQTQTTMVYHFIPMRKAITKKTINARKDVKKWEPV